MYCDENTAHSEEQAVCGMLFQQFSSLGSHMGHKADVAGCFFIHCGIHHLLFFRSPVLFLGFFCWFSHIFITILWGTNLTASTWTLMGRPWTE